MRCGCSVPQCSQKTIATDSRAAEASADLGSDCGECSGTLVVGPPGKDEGCPRSRSAPERPAEGASPKEPGGRKGILDRQIDVRSGTTSAEMVARPEVSFCATNLNTADRLPGSIDSIFAIGEALGTEFEVVVADGPSDDGAREILSSRARSDPRLKLVVHTERKRGYGRRRAFEASEGTTIVPFDTSLTYDRTYAGLLRSYLALRTDRLLFSEICALSRRSIASVGGWRDLIGGEDIDLYARVVRSFGVLAYPTALPVSQSARLGATARQFRYVRGSLWRRFRRIYAVQRDQMIGTNFRVSDLMRFNSAKPPFRRLGLWFFFAACAVGVKFRGIAPVRAEQNNYLYFRDALVRSLAAGDYQELPWEGPAPRLLLTEDEIRYLSAASELWHHLGDEVYRYVGRKE